MRVAFDSLIARVRKSLVILMEQEISALKLRAAAMGYLAMREHSKAELATKLTQKYGKSELLANVIETLAHEGLQSDSRYTEVFVTMRQRQGKGPALIKLELASRGVSSELIADYLHSDSDDWLELAASVRAKKFGDLIPCNPKDKARQMRFLHSRGFSSAHIQFALKPASN